MKTSLTCMFITASLLSSGCVSLLPSPAPADTVYRLAMDVKPVQPKATAEVVRIDRPSVSEIFNGQDIVVTMDGLKMKTVAQARFAEPMPVMVQKALIDTLSTHADFIGLLPTSGPRTETRLHLTIRNFEANFDRGEDSAPIAKVSYVVTYSGSADRKLLGTHFVAHSTRANSTNVSDIVDALQSANQDAMLDILNWMSTQRALSPA